ncbi:mechanosensitive ion channel family protein [Spirosoma spitsbergense]|uniref:mechanosensitive ion channel family protein n=1 Tax=Spirosoma spitsbergense TaxID=431554 RepID=UPI0003A0F8A5|nr:mechanosensitive ion channel family protein [Spirosoma spitsbergense]
MIFIRKFIIPTHSLFLPFITLLVVVSAISASAQLFTTGADDTTKVTLVPQRPADSLGRRTPRGTVLGFVKAVGQEDYVRAARYLNLRGITKKRSAQSGPELAQALQKVLDQRSNIIPRTLISNDTTGIINDNLGPTLDLIGTAEANGEKVDILLEKIETPADGPIWLFSSETVQRMPALSEKLDGFTIEKVLPGFLTDNKWSGIPIGHWLAMFVLVVLAYLLAGVIATLLVGLLRISWKKAREPQVAEVVQAFVLPSRIYLAVWLFVFASQNIGVSIIIRQKFSDITVVVGLVAFLLLLWQLIDVVSQYARRWLLETGQPGRLSAVLFVRRGIKLVLIAFGIISVLNVLGWDVTTGLAAMGIGGIALALGAQKTIENFVGSITIIADQPLRVGDFCKVDDTVGTVEQIGMRSTRIRTVNRTIVVVPKGQLAALKIENFAFRDRLLFNPTLQLRYETTPDQIRYVLAELRAVLRNHPKVNPDPARVRFVALGENSLDLAVFAYINTSDFNEFLAIQEDLMLQMIDVVDDSGTGFAFPSQTLYMGKDKTMSEEKSREAERKVREWREKDELPGRA